MNFVRYDPDTGGITSVGYMSVEHIQAEIDAGKPTLLLADPAYFEFGAKRVDLATMQLVDA